MDPKQLRALRNQAGFSTLQLAERLSVSQQLVLDWESGTRFPTLRHTLALQRLASEATGASDARGHEPARTKGAMPAPETLPATLLDPEFATIQRKLLAHPQLYEAVKQLATGYADPTPTEN